MGQHVVTNVRRMPNYTDLEDYVEGQLDRLVSWSPGVETFRKLNSIRKMTVEGRGSEGFRLGIRFENNVREIKPFTGLSLQWLESLVGARLELSTIDLYENGGGYLYYMIRSLNDPDSAEDSERIYPEFGIQNYFWGGGNWLAWD